MPALISYCAITGMEQRSETSSALQKALNANEQIVHPLALRALSLISKDASRVLTFTREEQIATILGALGPYGLKKLIIRAPITASVVLKTLTENPELKEAQIRFWIRAIALSKGASARTLSEWPSVVIGIREEEQGFVKSENRILHSLKTLFNAIPYYVDDEGAVRTRIEVSKPERVAKYELTTLQKQQEQKRTVEQEWKDAKASARALLSVLKSTGVIPSRLIEVTSGMLLANNLATASYSVRSTVAEAWRRVERTLSESGAHDSDVISAASELATIIEDTVNPHARGVLNELEDAFDLLDDEKKPAAVSEARSMNPDTGKRLTIEERIALKKARSALSKNS